jgi:hypothetical protein
MRRLLVYKPAAQRELGRMDRSDAERIVRALEGSAATGRGDVKALKGATASVPASGASFFFSTSPVASL